MIDYYCLFYAFQKKSNFDKFSTNLTSGTFRADYRYLANKKIAVASVSQAQHKMFPFAQSCIPLSRVASLEKKNLKKDKNDIKTKPIFVKF